MRKVIIFFIIILLAANTAQASALEDIILSVTSPYRDLLSFVGLGTKTTSSEILGTQRYGYNIEDETIVKVTHSINPGTSVSEKYYFADPRMRPINVTVDCSSEYLIDTCNLHLEYEYQSINKTEQDFNLGPVFSDTYKKNIVTSIVVVDWNGTIGFGAAVQHISTSYTGSTISIPELKTIPLASMTGEASNTIDVNFETLTYDEYTGYQDQVDLIASGGIIDLFWEYWGMASTIVSTLIYFFKLIFFENPILAVIFAETMILMQSLEVKNMPDWWRRYIQGHVDLYNFISNFVTGIINMISQILQALKLF